MKKKCLITGATAVLGTAFKNLINENKISSFYDNVDFVFIGSKDCNLINKDEVYELFKKHNFSYVMHLAAVSGGVGLASANFQATLFYNNLMMLLNLLEASREFKIEKTLLTLSTGMYSPSIEMPYKESSLHKGLAHDGLYGYYYAKRMMEPALRAYRDQYKMNIIGVVPNGIFGENDNFDLQGAPLVPALIRRFHEAKEKNSNIEVWGNGSALREWTYSKDMAKAFLWCFENYNSEKILNVGSTEENSVKDIAFMIAELIGFDKSNIFFDTTKPEGVHKKSTDNSEFVNISSFEYTKFKESLKLTIDWFQDCKKNHPEKLRLYSKA